MTRPLNDILRELATHPEFVKVSAKLPATVVSAAQSRVTMEDRRKAVRAMFTELHKQGKQKYHVRHQNQSA